MSRASHVATFIAGGIVATATLAVAVPKDTTRFRTFDAFAQSLSLIEANYVDPVDEQGLIRDAQRGMLHNLDGHSTYLPPNRYQKMRQDTEGEFGGIGVVLAPGFIDDARPSVPPYPIVDELAANSPAAVAGIQIDDRVVSIDGKPTAETGKELKEAAASDVGAALADLKKQNALGALVLDLRSDPGGLVDQAILVADQFLDDGTIVTLRGRKGSVETQVAHRGGAGVGVPIIARVDGGTASAAEILAAALHDHDRAKLVGLPTYGKGTVQTFYELDDGSGLKLTTARYLTPKGNSLESKGIIPDTRVDAFTPEEIVAGGGAGSGSNATMKETDADDPQLTAAVQQARVALHRCTSSRRSDCFGQPTTDKTVTAGSTSHDVQAGDPG